MENFKKNKNVWLSGAAIIVVLALLIAGSAKKSDEVATVGDEKTEIVAGCEDGALFSRIDGKPCPVAALASATVQGPTDTKSSTQPASSSYDVALKQYDGKMIMLGASCVATPTTATFAPGTRVLIANNSTQTVAATLGDKSVNLRPYHYATNSFKTAGTFKVTCNGADAATITIQ